MTCPRVHERLGTMLALVLAATALGAAPAPLFQAAQPVWPAGREKEKNLMAGFRAVFQPPADRPVRLRVAASSLYRVHLNGAYVGHGPARGPHGWYRVDEWDLGDGAGEGESLVAIEVAGYNANSYYLLDQPAFLQAEIVAGGEVLAATGDGRRPFQAAVLPERVQKVQRYSFQRPFSEVYRLAPGHDRWRRDPAATPAAVHCTPQPPQPLLPRRVPYPDFALRPATWRVCRGDLRTGVKVDKPWKDRSLTQIGPQLGGYLERDLESTPSLELQTLANANRTALGQPCGPDTVLDLGRNTYEIVDFGCNLSGFIGARVACERRTRLLMTFDEVLVNGDVDFKRLSCVNAVVCEFEPGVYEVESFEPYTLRYLKLIALEGGCSVRNVCLREYVNPDVWEAHFAAGDDRLNRLFAAGRETFRQNALDVFMDCPSRERAGWLCDSFFTARVAFDLCGDTVIERNFFENYRLPSGFAHLPEGMLPMCYPADHNDGVFIPNWALWFVVQLEEYLARSGDRETVDALRPRVARLFEYFKPFRNADGLLEGLKGWVFVEWSKANDFVQDVNYPSNMLLARALLAAGRVYAAPEWIREAEHLRQTIRRQSFDGQFFVDNATRNGGRLQVTRNRTEVCQYFAFYFDIATPESHPQLWKTLTTAFGPQRKQTKAFPEVHPANAFIGTMLRLELLSRHGLARQNLDESIAYLLYMADQTGTLWENDGAYASCNHGFASHVVHVLYRDVLGLARVDPVRKRVRVRFPDLRLDWCRGGVPTPDGRVELSWRKAGGKLRFQASAPAGYRLDIENRSGLELDRQP
ncbi:MAG: hypothetical protein JXQ71_07260 [Verrucomicrobia bacterium]|nr:hypothetical protein [Verrucomicrobiota bacterium]